MDGGREEERWQDSGAFMKTRPVHSNFLTSDHLSPGMTRVTRASFKKKKKNFIFSFFCLFRAAPVPHGGSQVKGQIRAVVAGLCHSH